MFRWMIFACMLLFVWLGLLGWAANMRALLPWSAHAHVVLAGQDFRSLSGKSEVDDGGLRVLDIAIGDSTVQSVTLDHLHAADYPILRYRFAGLPNTLELALIFRRSDSPDDVRTVTLPWPGNRAESFNLAELPDWSGEITEIGFLEYSTPQLVPPGTGFRPFHLVQASFSTPSWRSSLRALASDWLSDWPWTQRSAHSLGRDADAPRAQAAELTLALGIGLTVLLGWLVLQWRGPRLVRNAMLLIGFAWLLLDLRWQASLQWKTGQARALYANIPAAGRVRVIADVAILDEAQQLMAIAREQPRATRVLVAADSGYELLRLLYLGLPLNAGMLSIALADTGNKLPEGTLLAFYNMPSWRFDSSAETIGNGQVVLPATPVFQDGILRAYRVGNSR